MDALILLIMGGLALLGATLLALGDPQRVGIAATLLGGVLGFAAAVGIERLRQRYEAAHRFEGERRAAYVRLIEAADAVERGIRDREIAIHIRKDHPAATVEVGPEPDFKPLDLAASEIALLSPILVEIAAHLWVASLRALSWASGRHEDTEVAAEAKWQEAGQEVYQSQRRFLDSAKRDLDLPTGVMSKWQERIWRLRNRLVLRPKGVPKASSNGR